MLNKAMLILLSLTVALPTQGGRKKEPTLAEILSGKALNGLLGDINAAHAKARRGPNIPLDPALVEQINVAPPGGGNFGLLRKEKLTWPTTQAGRNCGAPARPSMGWYSGPSGPSSRTPRRASRRKPWRSWRRASTGWASS